MLYGRTTLSKFVIEQLHTTPQDSDLAALLIDVGASIKAISSLLSKGALSGHAGDLDVQNVQGETQKKLDVVTNDTVLQYCEWNGRLAATASEEMEHVRPLPDGQPRGRYLLAFDPLDGSSNLDLDVAVGTIFSVLRHDHAHAPTVADFLQAGSTQVAAGYAIYGPSTVLVLTIGSGTHGFTLDREIGNFILTHANLRIPESSREFAINTANERHWEPPVQRYVEECKAGVTGPRERDFNMRWIASMVAEVHRILMRGGVFLYPRDSTDARRAGRLRLLYEASPMAMLVEQAGGRASTGRERLLDVVPESLHQRIPVILGSREEVERLEDYHREHDAGEDHPFVSPLFNTRSLFRPEAQA